MSVTIVDYGASNLHSVEKAFNHVLEGAQGEVRVTSSPEDVLKAERLVLPGVGAFKDCMQGLQAIDGMVDALREAVLEQSKPFFGICVGMQVLADYGLEGTKTEGLGWIPGEVRPIEVPDNSYKLPHMGWNNLKLKQEHPIVKDVAEDAHAYFVHSYCFDTKDSRAIIAEVAYGMGIAAILAKDTVVATQFHPEKSHSLGLTVIRNFLTL